MNAPEKPQAPAQGALIPKGQQAASGATGKPSVPALSADMMVDLVALNKQLAASVSDERKGKTRVFLIIIGLLVAMVIFLSWLAFVHFPQDKFLATDNTAGVCRVPVLDKPYIPQAQVMDFAEAAVVSIYTYNYGTYRRDVMQTANTYFSNDFSNAFVAMFSNSADLQEVIDKRFNVTAVSNPTAPPVVARAGLRKGVWSWEVMVPVQVYYVSGATQFSERKLANVTVIQVPPTRLNPYGLAVDNIVLRQALN
jgi:hypothetical protein